MSARLDIRLDEGTHTYRVNGEVWPGVTSVLERSGLVNFSRVPEHIRTEALLRGSRVHRAVQFLVENDLDESSVDDADRGYLEAARSFLTDARLVRLAAERRVAHRVHRYAGTADLLAWWDSQPAVIDWKSSINLDALATDIQLAAYVEALREDIPLEWFGCAKESYVARIGVSLRKDGSYRVQVYDDPRDFSVFLAALTVANEQRRRRKST